MGNSRSSSRTSPKPTKAAPLPGEESPSEMVEEDAGSVLDTRTLPLFDEKRHHATTASKLAWAVFGLLAGTGLIQYVMIAVFGGIGRVEVLDALSSFFSSWLPVVSGFFGAAVTYYFTRERS